MPDPTDPGGGPSVRGELLGRSRPSSSPRRRSLAERAASFLEWSSGSLCALSGIITPSARSLDPETAPLKAARNILTE